ncbi:MAG: hypothetical protein R2715_06190 [Ilumatobacteraceae bacterium]
MDFLEAGNAVAAIDAEHGGRLAQLTIDGRPVLADGGPDWAPMAWGCYPMVPYAGRVRHGEFWVQERLVQLPVTMPPHAIHGTGYLRAWERTGDGTYRTELGPDWPWAGAARSRFELTPGSLTWELSVEPTETPFPAQVGWHPWFRKPQRLEFTARQMYRRDDEGIPDGSLVAVPEGPWDDCFVGVETPVRLHWEGLSLAVDSDCTHWVVYDEQDRATCVEPQSGPPDGFNLAPVMAEPGLPVRHTMTWTWH